VASIGRLRAARARWLMVGWSVGSGGAQVGGGRGVAGRSARDGGGECSEVFPGGAERGVGNADSEADDDAPGVAGDSGGQREQLPACPFAVRPAVNVDVAEVLGEHRQVGGQVGGPHPDPVDTNLGGGEVEQAVAEFGVLWRSSIHARSRNQCSMLRGSPVRLVTMKLYA
jgi:hypothetical protein